MPLFNGPNCCCEETIRQPLTCQPCAIPREDLYVHISGIYNVCDACGQFSPFSCQTDHDEFYEVQGPLIYYGSGTNSVFPHEDVWATDCLCSPTFPAGSGCSPLIWQGNESSVAYRILLRCSRVAGINPEINTTTWRWAFDVDEGCDLCASQSIEGQPPSGTYAGVPGGSNGSTHMNATCDPLYFSWGASWGDVFRISEEPFMEAFGAPMPMMQDEPPLPSVSTMMMGALETAFDVGRGVLAGDALLADSDTQERRLAVCGACDHLRKDGRCGMMDGCGCYVSAKARLKAARCPLSKWDRFDGKPAL